MDPCRVEGGFAAKHGKEDQAPHSDTTPFHDFPQAEAAYHTDDGHFCARFMIPVMS